jgi:hypothetical protein
LLLVTDYWSLVTLRVWRTAGYRMYLV